MDANGIYDIDRSIKDFLKRGQDWCKNREQAWAFEDALKERGIKFTRRITPTSDYECWQAEYTLIKE